MALAGSYKHSIGTKKAIVIQSGDRDEAFRSPDSVNLITRNVSITHNLKNN